MNTLNDGLAMPMLAALLLTRSVGRSWNNLGHRLVACAFTSISGT